MEIVKIDFPETLAVCIFCRMMINNAYNSFILPLFPWERVFYLKHIFCFFKPKIAGFQLPVAEMLFREYYMHFSFISRQKKQIGKVSGKSILTICRPL